MLAVVGKGGMGTVFRALDTNTGRLVALKRPRSTDAEAACRLENEFEALRRFEHPAIVTPFERHPRGEVPWFTMELVDGVSIVDYCAAHDNDPRVVRLVGTQLFDGLGAIHRIGMVHGDLKPENVLVDPSGRVVIVDFGVARSILQAESDRRQDMWVGTPAYMAPEQLRCACSSPATDLYGAGVILHECIRGTPAFPQVTHFTLLDAKERGLTPSVQTLGEFSDVVCALLSADPCARPSAKVLRKSGPFRGRTRTAVRTRC